MIKGSLRTLLLGTAVSAGLVASAGTAQAVEYNFGGFKMNIDTTVSAGASMRTAGRDNSLLPTSNGGPLQGFSTLANGCTAAGIPGTTVGANCDVVAPGVLTLNGPAGGYSIHSYGNGDRASRSGSINTDDGRLNFDRGDLTGGVVKMTNDFSGGFQNYKFFVRLSSYYDAVLANGSSYARTELNDGLADAARDIKLLDAYVSADYNIGELPLNLRAGKQVISWGESTFIQNGINTFNPIDVSAVRRPGSELKEFFVPVWALDASIGLPHNVSLEAFYQLKWDTYAIDRTGTPFASSDVAAVGGNNKDVSWLTGGPGGNILRNCSNSNAVTNAFTTAYQGSATAYAAQRDCTALGFGGGGTLDMSMYNSTLANLGGWLGQNTEALRLSYSDTSAVTRDEDRYAKNSGQWGVAARWYSEDLNNTEFGLYFSNTHSRLPIASERVRSNGDGVYSSYLSAGVTSSNTGRALPYSGCNAALGAAGGTSAPGAYFGVPLGLSTKALDFMNTTPTGTYDPDGVYAAGYALAAGYYAGGTVGPNPSPAGSPFAGGITGVDLALLPGVGAGFAGMANSTVQAGSMLEAAIVNCALAANQTAIVNGAGTRLAVDGTEILFQASAQPALGLFLEYPEDIHMVGASFNTTIGTWGVQGEGSFRSNAPVQLDTDQITINALNMGCTFEQLLGATAYQALIPQVTNNPNPDTLGGGCGDLTTGVRRDIHGYQRTKMFTAQVGTTATYSNSNALINGLGADLGILVSEVGLTYFPDAPAGPNQNLPTATGGTTSSGGVRWGNVCTSGTDLPLGGFLALASRSGCRPTTMSWGYVLLGQLQYNNAFGTAFTLSPTLAFSHDVSGNTPAPYSNYRQGRKSINLGLNGSYQSWKGGLSYTNFLGGNKYSDAGDRDYVSANVSYAF